MLSWAVEPRVVRTLVPRGTVLDHYEGLCLLSLVGLLLVDVRVRGVAVPGHTTFEQLNLRTYVRRDLDGDTRRGVAFVRELVPLPAVALAARLLYAGRHAALPMRHEAGPDRVAYGWRLGGSWEGVALEPEGGPALPEPGSAAEFVVERYWGYAGSRLGTLEYRIEHPPWRVQRARVGMLNWDPGRLYGPGFAAALAGPPRVAFLAEGSSAAIGDRRRLPATAEQART